MREEFGLGPGVRKSCKRGGVRGSAAAHGAGGMTASLLGTAGD